ncbi:MAG: [Bacteroidales bacterium]|nr:[FeFe] hydrogenase H-cluster maturation GTPase HydF [Bacteroidales bacterium]
MGTTGNELKPRIGLFGRRNQGKSTLINFITGQEIAIVSAEAGTTTDPVRKTMEISGVGPVVWVDTAGIDDQGDLGTMRVKKTMQALAQVNLALIIFSENNFSSFEENLVKECSAKNISYLLVYSKTDINKPDDSLVASIEERYGRKVYRINTADAQCRDIMLEAIRQNLPQTAYVKQSLLGDVLQPGSVVVLVTPIDSAAPEGRLILPQVQVIRDVLDNDSTAIVCKETQLESQLKSLKHVDLVVTDSQAFKYVSQVVPQEIPLTSFSIVLARHKGPFESYLAGTPTIASITGGDRIAMLESCTHRATCEDIGRVKLPNLIRKFTDSEPQFDFVSGFNELPRPLAEYKIVIQCGGCVVTGQQLESRLRPAIEAGIPVSNYGMAIAYMTGIFDRAVKIFRS